jgi:replication-associated recombination protein RarA
MTTLYRKYRPQKFSEIIGQRHIVQTLTNAIKNNRIGQAYLFTGPRGTGKTTLARVFAKAVNCANLVGEERAGTKLSIRRSPIVTRARVTSPAVYAISAKISTKAALLILLKSTPRQIPA